MVSSKITQLILQYCIYVAVIIRISDPTCLDITKILLFL